jgi:hypothetical protein
MRDEPVSYTLAKAYLFVALINVAFYFGYKVFASEPFMVQDHRSIVVKNATVEKKGVFWKTLDGEAPRTPDKYNWEDEFKFSVYHNNKAIEDCINNNYGKKLRLYYYDYMLTPYKSGRTAQVYKCEVYRADRVID